MTSTIRESLVPGMNVVDASGYQVGMVRDVRGGYFDLDCGEPDFWLSTSYVELLDDQARLSLSPGEMVEHRLSRPGLEPGDDIDQPGLRDHVIGDAEALTTREHMEHELREQRGGAMDSRLRN